MATIVIASRPLTLDGCFATWSEKDAPSVLRSEMDMGGFVKVRRRTTAASWQVEAGVTLASTLYADFQSWFRVNCAAGSLPTRVKRPDGTEVVMRFTGPPGIEWLEKDKGAFRVSVTLEQLPAWVGL